MFMRKLDHNQLTNTMTEKRKKKTVQTLAVCTLHRYRGAVSCRKPLCHTHLSTTKIKGSWFSKRSMPQKKMTVIHKIRNSCILEDEWHYGVHTTPILGFMLG